jgi:pimeloyl-ACP methyl ester carboxylesterase
VLDFAADVAELCDGLEIDRFAVVGLSGGGPYALACAHEMPARVVTAVLLGGVAPAVGSDKVEGGPTELVRVVSPIFARTYRPMGALAKRAIRRLTPFSDSAINLFARFMPPGDRRIFADQAVREMFTDDILVGNSGNMQAAFLDAIVFGRHWGFELWDINVPVHLWYGDSDNIVPLDHGQHMAGRIPNSLLRVRPDEGHLGGLGASHEVLDAVLREWENEKTANECDSETRTSK